MTSQVRYTEINYLKISVEHVYQNDIEKFYNSNMNSQLDATITNFIDNYNQLYMFRVIITPILRSIIPLAANTVWCFWGWAKLSPATCWADCNYQQNLLLLHLVCCLYYCNSGARSQKHQNLQQYLYRNSRNVSVLALATSIPSPNGEFRFRKLSWLSPFLFLLVLCTVL